MPSRAALDAGFTSVMVDGSKLPLQANIDLTAAVAELAHAAGASCEGEIGFVGYAGGAESAGTDPDEAARFARETGVDAMAISVGNVHLQLTPGQGLDLARLRAIEAVTTVPLVIHGGSGVPLAERTTLAATSHIAKFNIGTELRAAFGTALRDSLARDPAQFDRIAILKSTEAPLTAATRAALQRLTHDLGQGDLFDVQESYVMLFDRSRTLSLNLFEHVHGESRDRGQAMVDLRQRYLDAGLEPEGNELPDYLPVLLEFASTQPPQQARDFLAETAHIVRAIFSALRDRQSAYASLLAAVLDACARYRPGLPLMTLALADNSRERCLACHSGYRPLRRCFPTLHAGRSVPPVQSHW